MILEIIILFIVISFHVEWNAAKIKIYFTLFNDFVY